jgi:hypothetical protein
MPANADIYIHCVLLNPSKQPQFRRTTMIKNDNKQVSNSELKAADEGQVESRNQQVSSDKWILRLLVLAALVCGWMCFQGALGIFGGHAFTALPFAVVVQGVILIALWQMAYRPFSQKMVLAAVWVVAALFSTGSAFFYADKNNWESVVIDSRKEANGYFGRIGGEFDKLVAAHQAIEAKVKVEESDRGCGPKCRALKNEAGAAKAKLDAAAAGHKAAQDAAAQLNGSDASKMTLQDVSAIVDQVRAASGELGKEVAQPVFPNTLNFFERVGYVYGVILGMDPGKSGERFKFALTLGLASLVEILGLLLSVIHVLNHLPADPRPFSQRLANRLGRFMNLRNLMLNGESYGKLDQTGVEEDLRKLGAPAIAPQPIVAERKANAEPSASANLEREWLGAITAQARIEKKAARDLIVELMPGSPAALTSEKGAAAFFNSTPFNEKPVLGFIGAETGVIRMDADGLRPGTKWVEWQKFLMRKLTHTGPAPKSKRPTLLRAVGT